MDDRHGMMISDEQVRLVTECLRTGSKPSALNTPRIAPDPALVADVVDMLAAIPELREDRIEHARQMVDGHMPASAEVASKLVGRVLSDSLR